MLSLLSQIKQKKLPEHIAIIMDGNGRWAKKRHLPRVAGHHEGVKSVRDIVEACGELDIKVLTLYTFSTENWNRPVDEVSALMKLLIQTLNKEINELAAKNVQLKVMGDLSLLPDDVMENVQKGIESTSQNTGMILNMALSYGSREEMLSAIRDIAYKVKKNEIDPEKIDSVVFQNHLYTKGLPDPDLLIRTSGEFRVSNFLLWQLAYSEFYVTDVFWPEFRRKHLYEAIESYQKRERRFGKTSEQL